jgi:ketosteroid isomerase-like protein
MGEAENKQVVRRAFDAWAAGEGGVFDLLAPDARWTIVGNSVVAGTYHSREGFLASVIRPFNAGMATPLVPVVHGLYADGDTVIATSTPRRRCGTPRRTATPPRGTCACVRASSSRRSPSSTASSSTSSGRVGPA